MIWFAFYKNGTDGRTTLQTAIILNFLFLSYLK